MSLIKNVKNAQGSVLVGSLITTSLLFIAAGSFLLMISNEYGFTNRSYKGVIAINLAEGGVDYAIRAVDNGDVDDWAGTNPKTKTLTSVASVGGKVLGDVHIEVFDVGSSNPTVDSTAYVPDMAAPALVERRVRVELGALASRPFSMGLFAKIQVDMSGQGLTDSYDSRLGEYDADLGGGETNLFENGNIGTNGITAGAINLSGQATIHGDAATGPGGTVEMSGQAEVTGEISNDMEMELPPVEVPPELADLWYWDGFGLLTLSGQSSYTLDPGDYKFKRIKLSAQTTLTINGPANIYITGYSGKSIQQTGESEIYINGQVTFYCDDDVKLAGQGVFNSSHIPADLMILGTETLDWFHYSGQSAYYGVVYAPEALVDLSGQAGAYGAYVGNEIDASGQGGFHYDEALGELEMGGPSGFEVNFWQEKE